MILGAAETTGDSLYGVTTTILVWPLATAAFLLLLGKRLGDWRFRGREIGLAGWIAAVALARAFVAAVSMFLEVLRTPVSDEVVAAGERTENGRSFVVHLFDWITVGRFEVGADLLVDQLSAVMVLVVTGVSTVIAVYSIGYMKGDPRYSRYFAYLNLFAAAMLLLVLADNLLLLFVGWEGVGLCSYLLIGFWFERPAAAGAAKKAFIVNRIGDFSFLLGIMLLAGTLGTLTVDGVNGLAAAGAMTAGIATLAALLLLGGAVGKSAQIPLFVWLPDAMEGPTPASALIHAATMVTAGVYMVVRFSPVFEASGGAALTVVAWVGIGTALVAALIACTQYDIKRILAYSTISQLGFMFLAAGVGAYSAAIFHLITHAFFKALLFMGAGSVMHSLDGETDLRRMGGLKKVMPVTGWTFMIGWLAISGIVPFSGFVSKDAILAGAWQDGEYLLWALGIATALLTAFYMSRLYLRVFEGDVRVPEGSHPHESPPVMTIPLIVLGVLSVIGGVINLPGALTLEHFLEPAVGHFDVPAGLTAWLIAGAALLVAIGGIALANHLYLNPAGVEQRRRLLGKRFLSTPVAAASNRFYVDEAYGRGIVLPGKSFASFAANVVDARLIDGTLTGSGRLLALVSEGTRRLQSGYVRNYALIFLLGVVIVMSVIVLRVAAL